MVRAQLRGVIDWSEVKFFDRQWWRRARLLTEEMVAEDTRQLRVAYHQHAVGLRTAVAIGKFGDDAWEKASDNANKRLEELFTAYRPWDKQDQESREKEQAKRMIGGWERRFGDMNDVEVQRRIQAVADAMMQMAEQEPPELQYRGTLFNAQTAKGMPVKGN